jgi:uncharacterized protein YbcI
VCGYVGFFVFPVGGGRSNPPGASVMAEAGTTMAERIAEAASAFEHQATGHAPHSVTAVLSKGILVVTLHGALSPAESALAGSPGGAARVQEFRRQLFASASNPLRQEIQRITGAEVREATAEVEPANGIVVKVFTTGTVVQVFLLARRGAAEVWTDGGSADQP